MSYREPFLFPYVTSNVPRWPPTPVVGDSEGEQYVLKPGEDAARILNSYPVVHLVRGATYFWHGVDIVTPVTLNGNGATVRCPTATYCLKVMSTGTKIVDCKFVGKNLPRNDSEVDESGRFAIWLLNSQSSTVSGCSFSGFGDGAVCVFNDGTCKAGRHHLDRCVFEGCKAAVVLMCKAEDLCEGGVISNCRFLDCQFGLYAVAMFGWVVRDCYFDRTRSGVFHVRTIRMSYGGSMDVKGALSALGLVTGCLFRSSVQSDWPSEVYLKGDSNNKVQLSSYYFDDDISVPTRVADSVFVDSDVCLGNILHNTVKCNASFVTGCTFWFTGNDTESPYTVIRRLDGTGNDEDSDAWFTACNGRMGCKTEGIGEAYFEDSSFCVGLVEDEERERMTSTTCNFQ